MNPCVLVLMHNECEVENDPAKQTWPHFIEYFDINGLDRQRWESSVEQWHVGLAHDQCRNRIACSRYVRLWQALCSQNLADLDEEPRRKLGRRRLPGHTRLGSSPWQFEAACPK